ncbi:hypothetical protein HDE68_002947 [Pedobacter cryoconitis]|uniref:SIR2-like domain-containing protein n=1 Tax=Pedobacter cryoconitis TaxID=188932 RepID=A0A7W8ZN16_9SPHI|nr:SIR2 family protein [Pedobacter cryoconitis]MBB5637034.1 hypothetical protein [Pedobacter cryoconitis]
MIQVSTILKNQSKTITVTLQQDEVDKGKIELKSFKVIYESGSYDEFEADEHGFAKNTKEADPVEPKILLFYYLEKLKRSFYKGLIQNKYNEIENLVVLSGAGSSVGIGKDNLGLTMAGLWDKMDEVDKPCLERLIKETKYAAVNDKDEIDYTSLNKDLEALLTKAGMKNAVEENVQLNTDIITARKIIAQYCNLILPDDAPHSTFLNRVVLRPQKFSRVKIFTLNYDTLFEQAAAKEKFTVIDGFTFSSPRTFNGKYFDYDIIETRHNRQDKKDSTISKLFYLFKMHGSLNWKRNLLEIEQSDAEIDVEDRVMIFPQDSKYEHSYEQPYFEMMARFQQSLRIENTLLITIGFSFLDKHISSVILETLKQNPSLHLIVLTFPEVVGEEKIYQQELHRITELQSRVTMIAETFKDFTSDFPENIAHRRIDILEELNTQLKHISKNHDKEK